MPCIVNAISDCLHITGLPGPAPNDLVEYYPFDQTNPLLDASRTLGNLVPSGTPPTYQANCPWPTGRCAVFSSVSDSSGGGQFFTAPPINLGGLAASSGFTMCSWFNYEIFGLWSRYVQDWFSLPRSRIR